MRVLQRPVRATVVAALLAIGFLGAAVGSASAAENESDTAQGQGFFGPSVVNVPSDVALEIKPASGWQFADCAGLLAVADLVASCGAAGFTVLGPSFSPEVAPVRVSVPLVSANESMTVDYILQLERPEPPDAPDTTLDLPVQAGARTLIPVSDLGLSCGYCSPGHAKLRIRSVSPTSAGVALFTGSHVSFAAAPEARGLVEIDLRVVDDAEASSKTIRLSLHLIAPDDAPLSGLHVQRPLASTVTLAVEDLAYQIGDSESLTVNRCGTALHGAVRCTPEGLIEYTATGSFATPLPDQFSVQLVTADGRQALSSVTLTEDPAPLARAAGRRSAALNFTLPKPPESSEAESGATTAFTLLLDSWGAR